ncbi:hypothetical protein [Deinococcus maricopensis]|uniref:Uncharacterized protein n=1 Tax=Deinococcus maricopensis (strain DSM 21211 / LMG 22137 / NRRL B-23946 / LB-34) TaxID=709986 RepID=E8U7L1_DEIML|nr:hypothetical protein [Deinococcus maricopensis]ADV67050.1 hypothetical protein Deima_1400 [Deinococcus maricopensis DSM 21211]
MPVTTEGDISLGVRLRLWDNTPDLPMSGAAMLYAYAKGTTS